MKKKPTAMQYILERAKYYLDHPEDNPLDVFHYITPAEEVEDEHPCSQCGYYEDQIAYHYEDCPTQTE